LWNIKSLCKIWNKRYKITIVRYSLRLIRILSWEIKLQLPLFYSEEEMGFHTCIHTDSKWEHYAIVICVFVVATSVQALDVLSAVVSCCVSVILKVFRPLPRVCGFRAGLRLSDPLGLSFIPCAGHSTSDFLQSTCWIGGYRELRTSRQGECWSFYRPRTEGPQKRDKWCYGSLYGLCNEYFFSEIWFR